VRACVRVHVAGLCHTYRIPQPTTNSRMYCIATQVTKLTRPMKNRGTTTFWNQRRIRDVM